LYVSFTLLVAVSGQFFLGFIPGVPIAAAGRDQAIARRLAGWAKT
jgi:hypothetical protein